MTSANAVLCKESVLYLGSAVPIETTVGVEAFQMPCRERYSNALDGSSNVEGIDTVLVGFSSGLVMQYTADPSSNVTWFPIQSLHACAAVKATSGLLGVQFVALDSQEAMMSPHAPLFCAIMRRTQGIKVLECHVFMCKSTESALALVQATTYAFQHKEGWKPDDSLPPIISIEALTGSGPAGPRIVPANTAGLRQKYSINAAPAIQPPPAAQPAVEPAVTSGYPNNMELNAYTAGQSVMFIPGPPCCHEKKNKKKKKKKVVYSDDDDDDDDEEVEEEVYYCKRPDGFRQVPDDLMLYAPRHRDEYYPQDEALTGYSYYGGPTADDLNAEALAQANYLSAAQDYNAAVAAGVVVPQMDPGYLALGYAGTNIGYPSRAAYGDLVDGLGYYP